GDSAGPNYDVVFRGTDGSDPSRLGDGFPVEFSRDGKWVLAYVDFRPRRFFLYPRGAGEPQPLGLGRLENRNSPSLLSTEQSALVCGNERGKAKRCCVQDLAGQNQRPVTADGFESGWVGPDGRAAVVFRPPDEYALLDVDGRAELRRLPLAPGQSFAGWS